MLEVHICNAQGTLLRAYALGDSSEVLVGRDDSCDIQIAAQSVSREHCSIEREEEDLFLRDLGSKLGTFVNEEKIERVPIADGLQVKVGPAVLKFFNNEF